MRPRELEWDGTFQLKSAGKTAGITIGRNRSVGVGAIVIGISMLVIGSSFSGASSEGVLASAVVGLIAALFGLWILISRVEVRRDGNMIEARFQNLFGERVLTQPLASFRGVILRETIYRKRVWFMLARWGRLAETERVVQICLIHPDFSDPIPIWQKIDPTDDRGAWEKYSRAFSIPALVQDGDRLTARNPSDLNKSVKELAKEGKLSDSVSVGPPPGGFEVASGAEMIAITARRPAWGWWPVFFVGCLPGLFALPLLFHPDRINLAGSAVFAALVAVTWWMSRIRDRLILTRSEIRHCRAIPLFRDRLVKRLRLSDVEEVRVARVSRRREWLLWIGGDRGALEVAPGARQSHLEWLRDYVLAALATA